MRGIELLFGIVPRGWWNWTSEVCYPNEKVTLTMRGLNRGEMKYARVTTGTANRKTG